MQVDEIRNKDNPKRGFLFESGRWSDFIELAKAPSKGWNAEEASREGSSSFTGSKSLNEAIDLAENGWPEGRREFAEIAASSVRQMEAVLPSFGYDVAGMYPSVPRFVGGDMECMVTHNPDMNARKHVIPVYVSISASASNSTKTIKNRGAAIAGLIDVLETSGHSVQLVAFEHSQAGGIRYWGEYELKAAGEPLDLDMMSFALTHPSCLRRLHFSILESSGFRFEGNFCDSFRGSYGAPCNGWPEEVKSQLADGPVLMFDGLRGCHDGTFGNKDNAVKAVLTEWEKTQEEMESNNND